MSHQITPESYTALSEDLLADIQDIIRKSYRSKYIGPHNQKVADAKGEWVAVANAVTHVGGKTLVVHVVCDTAATAQQLTDLLNYYSVHAPTTW